MQVLHLVGHVVEHRSAEAVAVALETLDAEIEEFIKVHGVMAQWDQPSAVRLPAAARSHQGVRGGWMDRRERRRTDCLLRWRARTGAPTTDRSTRIAAARQS